MAGAELDALGFTRELRRALDSYLVSTNAVADSEPELRREVSRQIAEAGEAFFRQPLVNALPVYQPSLSTTELAARAAPPQLHPRLREFGPAPDRPLYRHQVEAVRLVEEGRNVVVATGTGSGKTEAFLLPILNHICSHPGPGVRAILVYPLNALANDQLQRLREGLAGFPDITFGRYTGETPQTAAGGDPQAPPNERRSRAEMHVSPPNILITNFAMLEYLLIRPVDARLFKPRVLRFVVLDEAHTYRGAQAIEIGLLLRRVRHAFAGCPLQFILTSATLGDASETDAVAEFARRLTGLEFARQDVLVGEPYDPFPGADHRVDGPTLAEVCRLAADDAALQGWVAALDDPTVLAQRIRESGWSTAAAALAATSGGIGAMLDAFLRPLKATARMHALTTGDALPLPDLAARLWGVEGEDAVRAATWLLVLAARARPRGSGAPPLVPARFHYVLRGLSGATVCLNPDCPRRAEHPSTAWSAVFLEDRAHCPDCRSPLFPLATCAHCGQPYVVVARDEDGRWRQHVADRDEEDAPDSVLWLLWSPATEADEEEAEVREPGSGRQVWRFCLNDDCRRILPGEGSGTCCSEARMVALTEVEPSTCPRCRGSKGPAFPAVARRFRTTDDAATSVIAETLIRLQPSQEPRLPAGGRRLLAFSDSRQRAAFFVPYLTRTSAESAIRSDLYSAFRSLVAREAPKGAPLLPPSEVEPVDFVRLVRRYTDEGLRRPVQTVRLYDERTRDDAYEVEDLRSLGPQARDRLRVTVSVTLLEEVCGSPWRQQRMLGVGLAAPEVFVSAEELAVFLEACPALTEPPGGDGYDAVQALLGFLLRWTAVTLPEGVYLAQLLGGANVHAICVAQEEQGRAHGVQVRRWNPYRSRTSRPALAVARSGVLGALERMLELDRDRDADKLKELLDRFWDVARDCKVLYAAGPDPHYQLRHERIVLTDGRRFWRCPVCGGITIHPYRGRCLLCGQGQLRPLGPGDVPEHRRARYQRSPLAIVVKEHTAQIDPDQGRKYQDQFREGKVNVLSSSTTFELGIDVGQLKIVLLRNVPPTASQYVQRAGRAGRRTEGAAFAVTYARSAPHDQYHYHRPEAFVQGAIRPPRPDMRNRVLAQRHVQSYLLGRFLRHAAPDEGRLRTGAFLDPGGLAEQAARWWADETAALAAEVEAVLPAECDLQGDVAVRQAYTGLEEVREAFTMRVAEYEREREELLGRVANPDLTVRERMDLNQGIGDLDSLIKECKATPLLDHLSEAHWLPGYAFPQDVVRLEVRQKQAAGVRLQRDREYGISEYAPGAEVIADGKVLRSAAVELGLAGLGEVREYRVCKHCGRITLGHAGAEDLAGNCPCGESLPGRVRPFIMPRGFSTLVREPVGRPNISRRLPPPNAEVRQIRGADEADFARHRDVTDIVCGLSEAGEMFVANPGPRGRAFQLCTQCGSLVSGKGHTAPWGTPCAGATRRVDLAHEFTTHTLDLRFAAGAPLPPAVVDRSFWLSLCTGLHVGACEHLGIEPTDIGVTSRPYQGLHGQVVIYDRIPGGAGYTREIYDNLRSVLEATWLRLDQCPNPLCDRLGSCYSCLRSNQNQYRWDELARGPVADWLARVLGKV